MSSEASADRESVALRSSSEDLDRRDFFKRTGVLGAAGAMLATKGVAKTTNRINPSRVLGANDRINIALIGCGGRGSDRRGVV